MSNKSNIDTQESSKEKAQGKETSLYLTNLDKEESIQHMNVTKIVSHLTCDYNLENVLEVA